MGPSIHIQGVTHKYQNSNGSSINTLSDIHLDVDGGSFTAILGPSGCGKTTLLNILAGFILPTSGVVHWNKETPSTSQPGTGLSYAFQDANLLPWRTVSENIGLPLELMGETVDIQKRKTLAAITLVQLVGFELAFPDELSGGMRSRLALAQSLVNEPNVLLLDEPFGALDEQTSIEVSEQLSLLHAEQGSTIIMVTHSILQALLLADNVVIFSDRPAEVRAAIKVALPKPRTASMLEGAIGAGLFERIRCALTNNSKSSALSV